MKGNNVLMHKGGSTSSSLDLVRFIAAFSVLLGHGVSRFFGPFDANDNAGVLEKLFRVIFSGYGSHGVTIFFILSGLFIGYSVINQVKLQTFSWKNYLGRRVVRLWIVLLPALVLTLILDQIGLLYYYQDAIYSKGDVIGSINGSSSSISAFFGNAFFTQTILVSPFGTNGALWSLANEFWYYMLFPLIVFILTKRNNIVSFALFISLFILICWFIGLNIYLYFLIWLIGVGIVLIPKSNVLNFKGATVLSVVILLVSLFLLRISPVFENKFIERILVAIPFLIFVFTLLSNDKRISAEVFFPSISKKLAAFSYTLYLIHTPILCLVRAIFIGDDSFWSFTFLNMFFFMVIVLGITLFAYYFSLITEAHTGKLYKVLKL